MTARALLLLACLALTACGRTITAPECRAWVTTDTVRTASGTPAAIVTVCVD